MRGGVRPENALEYFTLSPFARAEHDNVEFFVDGVLPRR